MSARAWRPDGPGSSQAPTDVCAVHDRAGRLWTRGPTRWTCTGSHWIRWRVLVAEHGPVTETPHPDTHTRKAPTVNRRRVLTWLFTRRPVRNIEYLVLQAALWLGFVNGLADTLQRHYGR